MKIKTSPRVIYENNPLVEVLCQVRFDKILALETEPPAKFQAEFASEHYPRLQTEHGPTIEIITSSALPTSERLRPASPKIPTIYHFTSLDSERKVSISSEFLSFSCTKYTRWERFSAEFLAALEALARIYPQPVVRRVGLRYKDLIDRDALGLGTESWSELVSPFVGGMLTAQDLFEYREKTFEGAVIQQAAQSHIRLSDCDLLLHSALLRAANQSNRQAMLIDSDFFKEPEPHILDIAIVSEQIEILHRSADGLFRHCIKEKLHDALGPKPVN